MSEMTREQALAHFGVKGMKWGVRKQRVDAGPNWQKDLAKSMTDNQIKRHQKALTGKGLIGATAKLDKYTWGHGGRFEGYHNQKISELQNSKQLIEQGKLVTETILFGARYTKS
jgi:hypothetical protein